MSRKLNFTKNSFLVFGLGSTGQSVIKFLKKKNSNYFVWDDSIKLRNKFKNKKVLNLIKSLKEVDFIVLSPGISLKKTKYRKYLIKYKKKIIIDIDLLYLSDKKFKSIVVTGTNGKSTTCKIITHLLKKNKFDVKLGGNIGTPVLNLKIKRDTFLVIEASSFQLSHSQFIHPNYALLLNVSNDHLDWHGTRQEYIKSKLKIFNLQSKKDSALIDVKLKPTFIKKRYLSKLLSIKFNEYKKLKSRINNNYLKFTINEVNMNFVYTISKLLKISNTAFVDSMNTFIGLPHRYEIFLKRKNIIFINDSKATSFEASKLALSNSKNIYWILGGLPKINDKIDLRYLKKNIIKSYIIGKHISTFRNQLKKKVNFSITRNLKESVIKVLKDIKLFKKTSNTVLLSPSAASFDQFKNFEIRGDKFKELCKFYAKRYI
jgi:UDP-N-acetylmuramoylalanine--D-glutamate ligase